MDFEVTGPEGRRSLIAEGAISESEEGGRRCCMYALAKRMQQVRERRYQMKLRNNENMRFKFELNMAINLRDDLDIVV
jgi:hypothetical protein